jgi:hypothetical protein
MTITEIVERLDLALLGVRHITQFGGEADTALTADDPTYEAFLTPERSAMLAALEKEMRDYRAQCAAAEAVTTPKKAKKAK